MRLNEGVKLEELTRYGFVEMTDCWKKEEGISEYDRLFDYHGYIYEIGMYRRGQCYYLICSEVGVFNIYASEPDVSGAATTIGDIIIKLYQDGIITTDN